MGVLDYIIPTTLPMLRAITDQARFKTFNGYAPIYLENARELLPIQFRTPILWSIVIGSDYFTIAKIINKDTLAEVDILTHFVATYASYSIAATYKLVAYAGGIDLGAALATGEYYLYLKTYDNNEWWSETFVSCSDFAGEYILKGSGIDGILINATDKLRKN